MPLARRLEPELAHNLSLKALRYGLVGPDYSVDPACLQVAAFGRVLKNPIGLAAGFDKNAVAVTPLARLGFGFIEAGTVTRRPQPGNPRPRLFRLAADQAVINRMGFNNTGVDYFIRNIAGLKRDEIVLGANVGINKENADPLADYPMMVRAVSPYADYVTINISSPNTPGLRDLQAAARLAEILAAIAAATITPRPLFVKIAPDLDEESLAALVETCVAAKLAGLIISNTTTARPESLTGRHKSEAGGLSGAPLLAPSTKMLAQAYRLAGKQLMLIGVGGIFAPGDAYAKILAGASLVQVYTGFTYQGPALLPFLKTGLANLVTASGFKNISQAVGAAA